MKWEDLYETMFLNKQSTLQDTVCQAVQIGLGRSLLHICPLWDGVYLWSNEIYDDHLDYPLHDLNSRNYIVINLCIDGRCEVVCENNNYIYVVPQLLNINSQTPQNGYQYPGGHYKGIEIALDIDILTRQQPSALTSFGLQLSFVEELLKKRNGNYMAFVEESAMNQAASLFQALQTGSLQLEDYRFRTVALLYLLKNEAASETKNRFWVTKGQRRIVNEVEQLLVKDFREHFTVEELAGRYQISPSALKKYFEMVFGMPISYYLRQKRMEKAKVLLAESGKNVGEIASLCGYENQGKFGSAFKAYTKTSPLEYRRLHIQGE